MDRNILGQLHRIVSELVMVKVLVFVPHFYCWTLTQVSAQILLNSLKW